MNNIDYIANCRMIYYMAISMYYGHPVAVSDELEQIITAYSMENFEENSGVIKSLFCYEYKNGKYTFSVPVELLNEISSKISKYEDTKEMLKIYNSIGDKKVEELTEYAIKTCEYINEINNVYTYSIKQ